MVPIDGRAGREEDERGVEWRVCLLYELRNEPKANDLPLSPAPLMLRARLCTLPLRTARSMSTLPSLLSAAELAQLLRPASPSSSPGKLVLLDATWHMPNLSPPRHAYAEYLARRIPSAHFWDVDLIASHRASLGGLALAHMLPSAQMFQAACGA